MGRKKKGKGKRGKSRHTPLKKLKKKGSKLTSPMSELPFRPISWDRDFLPEHLWVASLAWKYGKNSFFEPYNAFCDKVDEHWPEEEKGVFLGLLSDFTILDEDHRDAFLEDSRELARELFWEPIGPTLLLYPECPAGWLAQELREDADGALDPTKSLDRLRGMVKSLLGGRSDFATAVRMVPFGRPLKNEKMFFVKGLPTLDLLPRYPGDLNEDERAQVESFVRSSMMALFGMREDLQEHSWPKHFWRKNYDLAVCRPVMRSLPSGTVATDASDLAELEERMSAAAEEIEAYLRDLPNKVHIDLYEPTRDEILFGLFSRVSRLFLLMLRDPFLWARDVGGILLRCLADTAITFIYLVTMGNDDDFSSFREYGEGQQKLLMLHLQDTYPGARSLEGQDVNDLEEQFTILPEFLDIELGHWAKKDARTLAQEAGVERLYRLVFSPASSDVHGNWLALKNSHLTFCEEALHRYHRLPDLAEPPFYVSIVETGRQLYEECRQVACSELGYPTTEKILEFADKPERE